MHLDEYDLRSRDMNPPHPLSECCKEHPCSVRIVLQTFFNISTRASQHLNTSFQTTLFNRYVPPREFLEF